MVRCAGHQDTAHAAALQRTEHPRGAGHDFRLALLLEEFPFYDIEASALLGVGVAVQLAPEDKVDGRSTGHPLVEEKLVGGGRDALQGHHLLPGAGMARHGIVEHAVHVDKGGADYFRKFHTVCHYLFRFWFI